MEKEQVDHEHIDSIGVATQQEDRAVTKWEAVRTNRKAVAWTAWAIFVLCLQGFDNQAGGIVVGVKEFRKDFGYAFGGDYVLPAKWQSAFSGGPNASAVFGSLFAGWLGDGLQAFPVSISHTDTILSSHRPEMGYIPVPL
jgi:SP family general alpha glucoside:H+ symporter-like MFS transporter